jgi:Putative transposase, YhgA-like
LNIAKINKFSKPIFYKNTFVYKIISPYFCFFNTEKTKANMNKQALLELINNPNDKTFKTTLTYKPAAVEYLETFLSSVAAKLDMDQLTIKDTNFIAEELEEYYSDVIYETYLKPVEGQDVKNLIRIILLFEHKKSIDSYFDLFLQIIIYIVSVWKQDRKESRPPTLVIPLVINQSKRHIKQKTLHDSLKNVPTDLLKYIPQFECHVLNVQPLDDEPISESILNLKEDSILRSLFLSFIAVEQKNKMENILIEIFKFLPLHPELRDYFDQLFVFLIKEGYFSDKEIKAMLEQYLSSSKEQKDMLTTAQVWEERGEKRGGKIEARKVVLRGFLFGYEIDSLTILSGLEKAEVQTIGNDVERVKEVVKNGIVSKTDLRKTVELSDDEIKFVLSFLEGKG